MHKNYVGTCRDSETLRSELLKCKKENPKILHYRYAFFPKYPEYIIVGSLTPNDKYEEEKVRISNEGFIFHGHLF